jgi:GNAT superfamily N-acetyltransferase
MSEHHYITCEITTSPDDIVLFRQFYNAVYIPEFPDSNEQESSENMEHYLQLKSEGWYKNNNYHILLYLDNNIPVAGAIIDYLSEPNSGVIEFLVVKESYRGSGLGTQLLKWIEDTIDTDSRRVGHPYWDYIFVEVNDPFKTYMKPDSMDPFERVLIWDHWGYKLATMPYIQPSLSADKEPVDDLLFACKSRHIKNVNMISSSVLNQTIYNYIVWAMRIGDPDSNSEYAKMSQFLEKQKTVNLTSLSKYVGNESSQRLHYSDLIIEGLEDLENVLNIYTAEFRNGQVTVPKDSFRQYLLNSDFQNKPYNYHLLSIRTNPKESPKGLASFFTFPQAGFGGYIILDPSIRNKGHLSEIITRIERTMVLDKQAAQYWYIECESAGNAKSIFKKRGFYEIDVVYRQPPLMGQLSYSFDEAPILHLMMKEFGEHFEPPVLKTVDILNNLIWIFSVVYQLKDAEQSSYYQDIKKQLRHREYVDWILG